MAAGPLAGDCRPACRRRRRPRPAASRFRDVAGWRRHSGVKAVVARCLGVVVSPCPNSRPAGRYTCTRRVRESGSDPPGRRAVGDAPPRRAPVDRGRRSPTSPRLRCRRRRRRVPGRASTPEFARAGAQFDHALAGPPQHDVDSRLRADLRRIGQPATGGRRRDLPGQRSHR